MELLDDEVKHAIESLSDDFRNAVVMADIEDMSYKEIADRMGCPSVYWLTQDFNATARKLYDQVAKATPFIKYRR